MAQKYNHRPLQVKTLLPHSLDMGQGITVARTTRGNQTGKKTTDCDSQSLQATAYV